MKALVKKHKGEGHIEVMDMPVPQIQDNEVLIKVFYAGICGTDIHIYHDKFTYWPPVILGHEFSGEIVKAGQKVKRFKVNERVVGEPHTKACGACYLCRTGNIQICPEKRSPGWGIDGAFAEYIKMPENLLHNIPSNVSMQEAALIEPCAVLAHGLFERGGVRPGETVVVFGAGPIGILAAQMAKIAGAAFVIMAGIGADEKIRFKTAEKIGCVDRFVNIQKENLNDVVMKITNKIGADLVIEASGAMPAIISGVDVLKKKGIFSAIGLTGKEEIQFPWDAAMKKVLTLYFNMSSSYTGWDTALKLQESGKLRVKPLISFVEPIENWETAFHKIQSGEAVKVLFKLC